LDSSFSKENKEIKKENIIRAKTTYRTTTHAISFGRGHYDLSKATVRGQFPPSDPPHAILKA
jgi:hypothetical protein